MVGKNGDAAVSMSAISPKLTVWLLLLLQLCMRANASGAAHIGGGSLSGCLDLQTDCGAGGAGDRDDSAAFATCQRKLGATGGGCVRIPAGRYMIADVVFSTSHVVWKFAADVVLFPAPSVRSGLIAVDGDPELASSVTNVSIFAPAEQPVLMDVSKPLRCPWRVRGIQFGCVDKFHISNVNVLLANNITSAEKLPCAGTLSALCLDSGAADSTCGPSHGKISNITSSGGWPGYGLLQMQTGNFIDFENLDGSGGVTLRAETGAKGAGRFVGNITGRNITCRDGKAAFMSGPHTQKNGAFHLRDLYGYGCETTADIGAGFASAKKGTAGMPPGYFSNESTIDGVYSYYKANTATRKCHVKSAVTHKWEFFQPSCQPCKIGMEGQSMTYNATITNVHSFGYPAPASRDVCMPGLLPEVLPNCGCPYK